MEATRQETYRNNAYSAGITIVSLSMLAFFLTAYTIVTPHFQYKNGTKPHEQEIAMLLLDAHAAKLEAHENSNETSRANVTSKITSVVYGEKILETKQSAISKKNTTEPSDNAKNLKNKFIATKSKMHATGAAALNGKDTVRDDLFADKNGKTSATEISKPLRTTSTRIAVNLAGRSIVVPPEFLRDTKDEGTVVVEITVNKAGQVIEADPNGRGTTTSNAVLRTKAKQAAMSTKFNADQRFEEQKGTLTIVFSFN